MSRTAVIVDAVRSPMGKGRAPKDGRPGGSLSSLHPAELLGQVLRALVDRTGVDPGEVEDVVTGCVSQVAEQSGPIGRWAWLGAGLPEHVPSVAVHRACGSSQQAVDFAAQAVIAGAHDVVVACGVESMSRVPMFTSRMGADPFGPSATERYAPGFVPQGVSAELIATRFGLDRADLDEYSARSHERASAADFSREIIPVTLPDGTVVDTDETVRAGTTAEKLGALNPSFRSDEMAERFPEIGWHVTPGNSSQLTDGAAAVLVMSEERAEQLDLTPRARVHTFGLASDDPITMLTGPLPATEKVLKRTGLTIGDFDHVEVNEAFAPVPLAWISHFGADPSRVNPRGGAIALGHPLGASGARLLTSMINGLEETGGRYGLQTMCEAGGMANATVVERI
ncbi:3-ketoacyl-CoA thiolase, Acetyl-CoA acetyltransferase [Pseudonocardia sp. Ae168_Ps1]|uniref:thiolase family protein n=1 Tax=unclassified Pseudonocardia TaxID=2619320 RepID=UPI00094AAB10|nr:MULTISPECIES: thiolase family protein [unclassified Pseudonocardia]OLL73457.1 3-ketoacyl-CoA thiolase Acetyl-CoA acetyltransferase [Pseudonocardia sp. Ae150A_Ps1]OLL79433.1 3-ketoacyl-CoA thiolase, Acetyl-CoA acetyltransferase [Pseudonocardia sp. Ae168_Ps1]OLL86432.1 3-ketoacyl-CoA thiolase, Acetyl-CoA acetyltransferase [Pseudonocardia sp. Ae263_Ps1]OLL93527.1 3-ketoacyl-CoA thiolase, Acetyl-CoA acetyltransferase [Pseudonocardia sp. Ae356_Ps1]